MLARPTTIEDAIDRVGVGRAQWVLLLVCGLIFTSDAAEVTFLSLVTEQLRCEWGLTSKQETMISQAVFAGMIFGAPFWGRIGDTFGRRPAFLLSSVAICTFGLATAACKGFVQLLIARAIVGFSVAGLPVAFDNLAEALPSEARGKFLLYIEYFWTIGSVYVTLIAWLTLETRGWQFFTVLAALPTLLASIAGYFLLAESPRWLVDQGRNEEALEVIHKWADANKAKVRFDKLTRVHEDTHVESWVELFTRSKLRKTTFLMAIVWFGFGISYYGIVSLLPRIFKYRDPVVPGAAVAAVKACSTAFDFQDLAMSSASEIVGVLVGIAMINKPGRTWSQAIFYALAGITAMVLAFRDMDMNALRVAGCVARFACMVASCATWVHTPELFPTSIRAQAHSVLSLISKVGAVLGQYLISDEFSQLTCGWLMAGISLAAGVAALFLPETAGRELSDMSNADSTEVPDDLSVGTLSDDESTGAGQFER